MADKKISALTSATTPLAGTEVLPIVQSSATVKVSIDNVTAGRDVSAKSVSTNGSQTLQAQFKRSSSGAGTAKINSYTGGVEFVSDDAAVVLGATSAGKAANLYSNGAETLRLDPSNNAQVMTGNFVVGTAAKGINFTANTPAAGMTSQLLNWYEEGDWTPTVTSTSGTITSYTASGTWTRIGRLVTVFARLTITNVGTGAGGILVDSLPYAATSRTVGTGRDNGASGKQVSVSGGGSGRLYVVNYDNTFPVTTGSEVDLSAQFYA